MQQQHVAMLFADVAGYTRLMEQYEASTHQRLMVLRDEVVGFELAKHAGQIVKRTGDGFLALFLETASAVACALGIQKSTAQREAAQAPETRSRFGSGSMLD